jgi:hypothetical protein
VPEVKGAAEEVSLEDIEAAVRAAVVPPGTPYDTPTPWVKEIFTDRCIVQEVDGTLKAYPFTLALVEGKLVCTLGTPAKVEETYVPVTGQSAEFLIAEADGEGRYLIRIIREGYSKNQSQGKPLYWSAEAIRSSPGMFNGSRVSAFRFGEELNHPRKAGIAYEAKKEFAVLNIVGLVEGDHVAEGADGKLERRAYLRLNESAPSSVRELLDKRIVGFSINCGFKGRVTERDGREVAEGFELLPTEGRMDLDMVSNPAAGGEVLRVAASILFPEEGSAMKTCPKCKKEYDEKAGAHVCAATEAAPPAPVATATLDRATESAEASAKRLEKLAAEAEEREKKSRVREAAVFVKERIAESKLPAKLHFLVLDKFEGKEEVKTEDVDAQIKRVRESAGVFDPTGKVRIEMGGAEPQDKIQIAIEALVRGPDPAPWLDAALAREEVDTKGQFKKPFRERAREAGIRPVHSFRKVFRDLTGHDWLDLRYAGDEDDCRRVAEAVDSSSFSGTWANVLKKYILANGFVPTYEYWRKLVKIVPITDFRPHRFIRFGVHGDLPEIAEKATYPELTDPTDEFETVTAKKHGGIISWTWEAGVNDDVQRLQAIIENVGQAWPRTLAKKIANLLTFAGMPTLTNVDNKALFATDHPAGANLVSASGGLAALDATNLATAIANMRAMKQLGVGTEKLNILPKRLGVPLELHQTVFDLLKQLAFYPGGSTTDNAWIRDFEIEPVVIPELADANDWFLLADPRVAPVIVAGFLGGREQADVYIQDDVRLGAMFQNDTQLFKTRGVGAVGAIDYRGVQFRRNTA